MSGSFMAFDYQLKVSRERELAREAPSDYLKAYIAGYEKSTSFIGRGLRKIFLLEDPKIPAFRAELSDRMNT